MQLPLEIQKALYCIFTYAVVLLNTCKQALVELLYKSLIRQVGEAAGLS